MNGMRIVMLTIAMIASLGVGTAGADAQEKKTAILCVSFGSSVPKGQEAISSMLAAVKAAFPSVEVRQAFTSRIIMRKIAKENNQMVDDVATALAKLQFDGYDRVAVLSTNMIPGEEYQDLVAVCNAFGAMRKEGTKSGFERIAVTEPLMANDGDFAALAKILNRTYERELKDGAVALFGHGSPAFGDAAYSALQMHLWRLNPRFLVGTVEGVPSYDDLVKRLAAMRVKRVTIVPAMLVAGDHAANDMAGDEQNSWVSMLKKKGYATDPRIVGLGENPEVRKMFVSKLRSAMKEIE